LGIAFVLYANQHAASATTDLVALTADGKITTIPHLQFLFACLAQIIADSVPTELNVHFATMEDTSKADKELTISVTYAQWDVPNVTQPCFAHSAY
jgi:hypothetical protein